jgi:hypothetical protein
MYWRETMNNKINGIVMLALGVLLAIIYFAMPTFLMYTYWLAVVILIIYGIYLYQKKG